MLDAQAPLINIGLGRSGSTLLTGALDYHPQVSFAFETHFLVPKLYAALLSAPDSASPFQEWRFNWEIFHKSNKNPGAERTGKAEFFLQERKRICSIIATMTAQLLGIADSAHVWGYKEIWNGIDKQSTHPWWIYDHVFPRASWLHLIRNPFFFAKSHILRTIDTPSTITREHLLQEFKYWTNVTRVSRQRRTTQRYIEMRYEDLSQNFRAEFTRILNFINLEWDDLCQNALQVSYCPSSTTIDNDLLLDLLRKKPIRIDGFAEFLDAYSYRDFFAQHGIEIDDTLSKEFQQYTHQYGFFDTHFTVGGGSSLKKTKQQMGPTPLLALENTSAKPVPLYLNIVDHYQIDRKFEYTLTYKAVADDALRMDLYDGHSWFSSLPAKNIARGTWEVTLTLDEFDSQNPQLRLHFWLTPHVEVALISAKLKFLALEAPG